MFDSLHEFCSETPTNLISKIKPILVSSGGDWPGGDPYRKLSSRSMLEDEGMDIGGAHSAKAWRSKRTRKKSHLSTSRRVINCQESTYYTLDGTFRPEMQHHFQHPSDFRGGVVWVSTAWKNIFTENFTSPSILPTKKTVITETIWIPCHGVRSDGWNELNIVFWNYSLYWTTLSYFEEFFKVYNRLPIHYLQHNLKINFVIRFSSFTTRERKALK